MRTFYYMALLLLSGIACAAETDPQPHIVMLLDPNTHTVHSAQMYGTCEPGQDVQDGYTALKFVCLHVKPEGYESIVYNTQTFELLPWRKEHTTGTVFTTGGSTYQVVTLGQDLDFTSGE